MLQCGLNLLVKRLILASEILKSLQAKFYAFLMGATLLR